MNTLTQLIEMAKSNASTTDWPYGESYFKDVICKYTPDSNRTTFTINYKKASKKQVEEYLNNI